MPGMGTGLRTNDPTIVSAFHTALLHQGLIVLLILAVAGITLNVLRTLQFRRAARRWQPGCHSPETLPSPRPDDFCGSPSVSSGSSTGSFRASPRCPWGRPRGRPAHDGGLADLVEHLVNAGPPAGAITPSRQPRRRCGSRSASACGCLSCRGEVVTGRRPGERRVGSRSLGVRRVLWGDFRPGPDVVVRRTGAVLFYCAAGALIALPDGPGRPPRLGRIVLRVLGVFFVGMALLQAWPGRGFWSGHTQRAWARLPGWSSRWRRRHSLGLCPRG